MKLILKYPLCLICCMFLFCNGLTPKPEIYEPDYSTEISVFGIISNDKQYEFVIVERTMTLDEGNYHWYWNEEDLPRTVIKDAVVTISSENDTVQFSFFQKEELENGYYSGDYYNRGIYLDVQDEFQAKPGETYHLRVEIPGNKVISGTAKVPARPTIKTPANNEKIAKRLFRQVIVNWSDHAETAAYQLFVIYETKDKNEFGIPFRYNALYHNIVNKPPASLNNVYIDLFYDQSDFYSNIVTLKVLAMDRNYYDYVRSHSGIAEITGSYINTVKGGIGVFGAVAIDSVNVILED